MKHYVKIWFNILIIGFCFMVWPAHAGTNFCAVPPGTAGVTPTAPYTNWATASTDLVALVRRASVFSAGNTITVSNGTYYLTNSLSCQGIVITSLHGAAQTVLTRANGTTNRIAFICLATMSGFTISNGDARLDTGSFGAKGGGLFINMGYMGSTDAVQNCIVVDNIASNGGGIYMMDNSRINNCLIINNRSTGAGGGIASDASGNSIKNCTIVSNTAATSGGGVYKNSGGNNFYENSIMYYNQSGDSFSNTVTTQVFCTNCCVAPTNGLNGSGNISSNPSFAGMSTGNYRLAAGSPCINAGTNQAWMTGAKDLDGNSRIINNIVDMGAYEYSNGGEIGLSATSLAFTATYGGTNPAENTLTINNLNQTSFNFTNAISYGSEASGWLSILPADGSVAGSGAQVITSSVTITSLNAGAYTATNAVTSTNASNSPQNVRITLTINQANQTISFPSISDQNVTSTVGLSATASSGLPVSFSVTAGSAQIVNGTNLSFTGISAVSITAGQGGNGNFNAAPNVIHSFTVTADTLSTPTGVTASDGTYTDKILVYWNAASYATGYKVWRSADNNLQHASVLGTSTTSFYLDTMATADAVYYYWIQAVNETGESALSAPDSGYCGSLPSDPASPTGVTASKGSYIDRISVTWQGVSGATQYEVWRAVENSISAATLIKETTGASYNDSSVSQGIYYYYWIMARNANKYSNYSSQDSGWCRLSPPAGLNASDGSYPYHIRISWTPVGNATAYEVWRAEVPSGSSTPGGAIMIAQTTGNYINDYETVAGTVYRYSVRTYNGLGSSGYSTDTGWREINSASTESSVVNDFDGDRLSDLAVFSPSTGVLTVLCSTLGRQVFVFGAEINNGLSGDFNGDGKADSIVYCANAGTWMVIPSNIGYNPIIRIHFGGNGNDPAVADFDGDNLADLAAYDETNGVLSVMLSNGGAFDIRASCLMGGHGYIFISADFDGDGLADPTVYSESEGRVTVMFSGNEYFSANVIFGGPGKAMSATDFDGDGKADPVLYEQATGTWIVLLSSAGYVEVRIVFGGSGYTPAFGDYDGDGKADPAVYRETDGQWLIMLSGSGYSVITETFGGPGYQPVVE